MLVVDDVQRARTRDDSDQRSAAQLMWVGEAQGAREPVLRLQVDERFREPSHVEGAGPSDDVEVVRTPYASVHLDRNPAYDDEVDRVVGERVEDLVGRERAVRRCVHACGGPRLRRAPSPTRTG